METPDKCSSFKCFWCHLRLAKMESGAFFQSCSGLDTGKGFQLDHQSNVLMHHTNVILILI